MLTARATALPPRVFSAFSCIQRVVRCTSDSLGTTSRVSGLLGEGAFRRSSVGCGPISFPRKGSCALLFGFITCTTNQIPLGLFCVLECIRTGARPCSPVGAVQRLSLGLVFVLECRRREQLSVMLNGVGRVYFRGTISGASVLLRGGVSAHSPVSAAQRLPLRIIYMLECCRTGGHLIVLQMTTGIMNQFDLPKKKATKRRGCNRPMIITLSSDRRLRLAFA